MEGEALARRTEREVQALESLKRLNPALSGTSKCGRIGSIPDLPPILRSVCQHADPAGALRKAEVRVMALAVFPSLIGEAYSVVREAISSTRVYVHHGRLHSQAEYRQFAQTHL